MGAPAKRSRYVVVAQMGLDPIMCALDHADIVICGRAYGQPSSQPSPCRDFRRHLRHAAKVLSAVQLPRCLEAVATVSSRTFSPA